MYGITWDGDVIV
jgi:hypothetical protein